MKIAVTGANGFIGKNLCFFLEENNYDVLKIHHKSTDNEISEILSKSSFVFHLAGVNRSENKNDFSTGNIDFTQFIIDILIKQERKIPIVLASSSQASNNTDYGLSKNSAEKILLRYSKFTGSKSYIYRLPNVFGKWCRPNYNSFIATFCNNIHENKEIKIHDPNATVKLVYIDDVCNSFLDIIKLNPKSGFYEIPIHYNTTVGEVADTLINFQSIKKDITIDGVGQGLKRALYSTFLSYSSSKDFNFDIKSFSDDRGTFCEMLKTGSSGQFSYFTAHPGITRGGHYHHTKNEKFLVIQGKARFRFKNLLNGDQHAIECNGARPMLVETIPGWIHDITNIGNNELIVMLWANEIFDENNPDTFEKKLC